MAISFAILFVGVPLAIAGLFIYATTGMCGNQVYDEVLSSNRKHKAVLFQRDCGATTGVSTQISIIDSDDELENESGTIYIIDGHPTEVAPRVRWVSNTELRIERGLNGSEYKAESSWGFLDKIKVTYGEGSS